MFKNLCQQNDNFVLSIFFSKITISSRSAYTLVNIISKNKFFVKII